MKELDNVPAADRFSVAGHKAEKALAFYLKRGFGRDKKFHVLNGIRLEHDDDAVQIDHLILHPYGFIIVESKSVHDTVHIDRHGHWCRTFKGQRKGMGSPILQAERQTDFLKDIFEDRREEVIGTLFGIQQGLGGRTYDVLVAISDNGRITCERGALDPRICKADEVVDRVRSIYKGYKPSLSLLDSRPKFRLADMDSIATFLVENHRPVGTDAPPVVEPSPWPGFGLRSEPELAPETPRRPAKTPPEPTHTCGKCGDGGDLRILWGPYGYYFKCGACGGNTKAQATCGACGKPARVRKQGRAFFAECQACGTSRAYFSNPPEDADAAE
ncbi:nuclease-related domain-containing protein [Caenispirillum salinarum]|uniref:nuclease-related domain-containing protein n=1 Tax=Caenispirillum salinarum TaxID=859058 RepID=UPI001360B02D|nr:nuclease-related domain-containing protein [Caenispirillum salinarum]